jgi:transposase
MILMNMAKKGRPITTVKLNETERKELEKRANSYTSQGKDSLRAKIVLLKSQNKTQEQIQDELNISRRTIMKWVNRFIEQGIEGLDDAPGRGRKPWISEEINNGHLEKLCFSRLAHRKTIYSIKKYNLAILLL